MKILFVDDCQCSKQNGIGTFRDVLIDSLSEYSNVELTLVSLGSDVRKKCVSNHTDGPREIQLPLYNGNWRISGDIIASELQSEIRDSSDTIFIMNYSPCADFIESVKRVFPLSRWIFVIHDQGWCAPLMGDEKLLSSVLHGTTPQIVSAETAEFVKDYCQQEIEIYNLVDKVVCLSESTYQVLKKSYHIPENKAIKIENGLDKCGKRYISKHHVRARLGIAASDKVLVFVARPVRHKGIDALLMAVEVLRRRCPDVKCAIAGDVHKIANHWELGKKCATNLILPGFLTQKELREWYVAADVGVMCSYTEQCSYAALEMMDAGLPIVASDGIGLRDMFSEKSNAFVAHISNVTKVKRYARRLADTIEMTLNAPIEQKRRYAAFNRRLLRTKYSADTMAEKYMHLFRELIDAE